MYSHRAIRALFVLICLSFLISTGCSSCGPEDPTLNQFDDVGVDTDIPDTDPDPDANVGPDPDADVDPDPDADPDADVGPDPDPPVEPIECENPIPEPTDGERCTVIPGSSDYILFRGTILAGNDVYLEGSLLLDDQSPNRRISCVGCECDTEPEALDATLIACPDGVVSPGLINPHDHLTFAEGRPQLHGEERFDHRHDWRRGLRGHTQINTSPRTGAHREGVLLGELRMLFGGATSIAGAVGNINASGFLRNLDNTNHTEGIDVDVYYDTFPLGDGSFPALIASGCDYPSIRSENVLEADIYLPHIGEGIDPEAHNELFCLAGGSHRDLIRENTSIIHGIAVDARDVALIAHRGANLVWSPRTNIDLYGNTAPVTLYHRFGVPISLGTDWSTSGSMNMLRELQCADYLNRLHYNEFFTDRDLFHMATYNGAISLGVSDQLGLLAEGYVGDITLFDGRFRDPYRAVIDAEIDDVILVTRGGDPLYGDADLLEGFFGTDEPTGCEFIDVCERDRRICSELDTGMSLAQIWSGVHSNSYPMFFCGEPENEPSCVPFRPSEYDGIATPQDRSGDGIPDVMDNCPDYFNPIRPMDGGIQSDVNGSGLGDVCDPCPLSGDPNCTEFDPNDWSGDGVPNDVDNCPFHYNPDQLDSSEDGIGDACHPCPEFSLLDGPCAGTIYDIKTGAIGAGEQISLDDVLVTASLDDEGVFIQVHPDDDGYDGPDHSGLYVFLRNNPAVSSGYPVAGDRIRIIGSVSNFFGQLQLANVVEVEVLSSDNALPEPVVATPEEVSTSGNRREALEGVLVRVEDLIVTDTDVPPGPGDQAPTNEFIVNDSLHINNFFYQVDPFPQVGDTLVSIAGVLRWANERSKLEPRFEADVLRGPPEITSLTPSELFIEAGASASIELSLSRPAEDPTTVDLSYGDPAVISGPATVSFAVGEQFATFEVDALQASETPVILEAELDEITLEASIRTYDDATERSLVAFGGPEPAFFAGETIFLTAELNVPAGTGGEELSLGIIPSDGVTFPSTASFDEGQRVLPIEVTLGPDLGVYVATATAAGSSINFTFQTFEPPQDFVETFTNLTIPANTYSDGEFVGDAGFTWEISRGRRAPTSGAPAIDGTSLIFAGSGDTDRYIRAEGIPGGISSFSVEMMQAFTGTGSRQLELFINDEFVARSISFGTQSGDAGEIFDFIVDDLAIDGDFDMEIRSVGSNQITIDNIRWTSRFPVDPDDLDFPDAQLQAFEPSSLFLGVGQTESVTLLLADAALAETTVALSSTDDDALDFPEELTIPAGESQISFDVTGALASPDPVELSATLDGDSVTMEITVFDDDSPRELVAFDGCHSALLGVPQTFFAQIDLPAGPGGLEIDLIIQPASAVDDAPETITIPAGEDSVSFELTFVELGTVDVFADPGTQTEMVTLEVVELDSPIVEDFDLLNASTSSYTSGSYEGSQGITWSYTATRRIELGPNTIDAPSAILGTAANSRVSTGELPGGLSTFSVDYRRPFDDSSDRVLELYVNGSLVATSETFGATNAIGTFEATDLEIACVSSLEVRNAPTSLHVTIDNIVLHPLGELPEDPEDPEDD